RGGRSGLAVDQQLGLGGEVHHQGSLGRGGGGDGADTAGASAGGAIAAATTAAAPAPPMATPPRTAATPVANAATAAAAPATTASSACQGGFPGGQNHRGRHRCQPYQFAHQDAPSEVRVCTNGCPSPIG